MNPQSCYGSPDFKSGPVPLWHRGKTQSAGLEPVSRRNDRLLSREFQYHYGTIAKVGRVGLEPTMHKRLSYGQLRYQFRASTQISFFFVLCKKDERTRLRRDGLEPSTLAHEASKLPLLYPAVGVVGLEPDDKSIKGRLLCQLSYTPIVQQQHDRLRSRRYRLTFF